MAQNIDDSRLVRHKYGFLQATKIPNNEELSKYYADKYYQNERGSYRSEYSENEIKFFDEKIHQKAELVFELRGNKQKGTILDVGCGEGYVLKYFDNIGWDVKGLDFSIDGVTQKNPHLVDKVVAGDLYELLEKEIKNSFEYDVIWLTNVLEHVVDPVALLQHMREIVGPKSLVVITVPNDCSELQEKLFKEGDISRRFWIALPDHLSYFDPESLETLCKATKWNCVDLVADFPIDLFLLHPSSNYIENSSLGPDAHQARVEAELLLSGRPATAVNAFYRQMAKVGLGRNLTVFLKPD